MIQDHNLKITEQEYRDLPLPSYSLLADIDKQGIDVIGGVKAGFTLKFGNLVDIKCFEPHRIDEMFYQGDVEKAPTANVKKICDYILSKIEGNVGNEGAVPDALGRVRRQTKISDKLSDYEKLIISGAAKEGVYTKYTYEKIVETVVSAGSEYFKDKISSRGKILIKPDMWALAMQTANTLTTHPFTAKYFQQNSKDIEIIYQYKAEAVVNGRRFKMMLDCVVINHKLKLIIPVDLKTGEAPCKDFPMLYTLHRYYIQGSLYREGLKYIVDNDFALAGYTVTEFEFVYISKLNPNKPMRFRVTESMHAKALNGFSDKFGYEYRGVYDLLEDYYYSIENGMPLYRKDVEDANGLVYIDDDLILGENANKEI